MNLADLETLLAVARERSFSRAAEKLRRTQPAVSLAIRRLEEAAGDRLLDRSGKLVRLTAAGELVVRRAEFMLEQRGRMEQDLLELRDKHQGKVTVGANESTAFFLLPVIEVFHRRFPRIKIEVRRSLSRNIPAEVLAGNLDLGIIAYDPEQRELRCEVVCNDKLAFIVYPAHTLARSRRPIAIERLGSERFIAHNVESPYREFTIATFRRANVPLHITLEMPTVEGIKHLVARGLGVAFVPRISVAAELESKRLVEVAVRNLNLARPLRLLAARRLALSPAAQAFWDEAVRRQPPSPP
ncbi:MAG TPA: LysR substrate-binding domain-containing protein [Terriglobales bacterium]